jgi:hypothetical protein
MEFPIARIFNVWDVAIEELKIKDDKNRQLTVLIIAFLPNEPMGCFMELMKKNPSRGVRDGWN